ncbi:MAG: DapH/DapD/GlmU-related protein [Candidatus Sifarchaeia archaeon]
MKNDKLLNVHPTAIIYPNVNIGTETLIGAYSILGEPSHGNEPGLKITDIGPASIIRSHTVIYEGNDIGSKFQTGHKVNIREDNKIGNNVSIGTHSIIEHHVEIADNVRIHSSAFIPEYSKLEEGSWIGPGVFFTNAIHPLCPQAKKCLKGPIIKRNAKIGANATLSPGVTIGEKALVGSGSVVVEDVLPRAVVVGNPARQIKTIDDLTCPFDLCEKPYD